MFNSKPPSSLPRAQWREWISLEPGRSWRGWCVGPLVGVDTHYASGAKGCRRSMTDGRLKCGYCESDMGTLWRGYVPLVDADGLACVSVVGEEMGKHAIDLKLGDQVVVTKLLRQGCPVRVVASNHTASTPAAVAAIKSPVDLKAWLLTVWKDEALASFFRQVAAGKLPDVITVVTPNSEVAFDMTAIEAKDKALVAKRNAEYMARIAADRNKLPPTNTKPSKNGKHNKAH